MEQVNHENRLNRDLVELTDMHKSGVITIQSDNVNSVGSFTHIPPQLLQKKKQPSHENIALNFLS